MRCDLSIFPRRFQWSAQDARRQRQGLRSGEAPQLSLRLRTRSPRGQSRNTSLLLWHLGFVNEALQRQHQAVVHARSLSHLNTLGVVYFYGAALHALCRNEIETKSFADQLSMLGTEHKLPLWSAVGTYFNG